MEAGAHSTKHILKETLGDLVWYRSEARLWSMSKGVKGEKSWKSGWKVQAKETRTRLRSWGENTSAHACSSQGTPRSLPLTVPLLYPSREVCHLFLQLFHREFLISVFYALSWNGRYCTVEEQGINHFEILKRLYIKTFIKGVLSSFGKTINVHTQLIEDCLPARVPSGAEYKMTGTPKE